jgi:hypothetical protein
MANATRYLVAYDYDGEGYGHDYFATLKEARQAAIEHAKHGSSRCELLKILSFDFNGVYKRHRQERCTCGHSREEHSGSGLTCYRCPSFCAGFVRKGKK